MDRQIGHYERGFVIRWAYRRARVIDHTCTLPREATKELEIWLSKCVDKTAFPDNHAVFLIHGDRSTAEPIVVQFSDSFAYFGKGVLEHPEGP